MIILWKFRHTFELDGAVSKKKEQSLISWMTCIPKYTPYCCLVLCDGDPPPQGRMWPCDCSWTFLQGGQEPYCCRFMLNLRMTCKLTTSFNGRGQRKLRTYTERGGEKVLKCINMYALNQNNGSIFGLSLHE